MASPSVFTGVHVFHGVPRQVLFFASMPLQPAPQLLYPPAKFEYASSGPSDKLEPTGQNNLTIGVQLV